VLCLYLLPFFSDWSLFNFVRRFAGPDFRLSAFLAFCLPGGSRTPFLSPNSPPCSCDGVIFRPPGTGDGFVVSFLWRVLLTLVGARPRLLVVSWSETPTLLCSFLFLFPLRCFSAFLPCSFLPIATTTRLFLRWFSTSSSSYPRSARNRRPKAFSTMCLPLFRVIPFSVSSCAGIVTTFVLSLPLFLSR